MKKFLKFSFTALLWVIVIVPLVSSAEGGTSNPGGEGGTSNPGTPTYIVKIPPPLRNSIKDIPSLINSVIDAAIIPIGSILAVLMIMYAGFLFVTARGDAAQIKKAREALLYACIGAAILLGAKLLAAAIQNTVSQLN